MEYLGEIIVLKSKFLELKEEKLIR